ncbi:chorion peroxidase-like isoform X2 [Planococcus citri]|uniref:chorion peroxidase-like isoform X2 n=1 Tax=Planococcus citri TaxID=170843 RepID=UPI0031F949E9
MFAPSWFIVVFALVQCLNAQQISQMCNSCAPVQPGQPFVLNAQPVDQQNIGDQCFNQPIQCDQNYPYRYLDGKCNNLKHLQWGMTNHTIIRLLPAAYSTNQNDPGGTPRTSVVDGSPLQSTRVISNDFFTDHHFPSKQYTLAFMVMSQLFTHDVLSLRLRNPPLTGCCQNGGTARVPKNNWDPGCLAIDIPSGDRYYSQFNILCSQVARAAFASDFNCKLPEVEQAISVTSYFDGSVVYGASAEIGKLLRSMQDGKLRTETSDDGRIFLPHTDQANTFCFVETNKAGCFQGSDFRANQHAQLAVIQVILLRIHNKICDELKKMNAQSPEWQKDEKLYQEAKKILTAMLQNTIYGRFSEILFGPECSRSYGFTEPDNQGYSGGYDPELNAGTTAEFEHVAFRSFHSLVEGNLKLYDDDRKEVGTFLFSDWFNNPTFVKQPGNLDKILIGMATQAMEGFDRFYTTSITQEFFKQFNQGKFGSDLAAIDVERGRDCGVPPYICYATLAGWPVVNNFDDLTDRMEPKMIDRLKKAYKTVADVDAIVGAILEKPFGDSMVGKTLHYVMAEQFRRYKFGDSFFYTFEGRGQFTPGQLAALRKTTLSLIFCWGSDGIKHMQRDAYTLPGQEPMLECSQIINDFMKDLWANWQEKPTHFG